MLLRRQKRTGAILVESALVYPILFILIFGIILVGMAVFRYQTVSHAAREGARWAIVKGDMYHQENPTQVEGTTANIYTYGIKPYLSGMDPANVTYTIAWDKNNKQTSTTLTGPSGNEVMVTRANKVSVKVSYTWNTGFFGSIPVSSTCVMTMSY